MKHLRCLSMMMQPPLRKMLLFLGGNLSLAVRYGEPALVLYFSFQQRRKGFSGQVSTSCFSRASADSQGYDSQVTLFPVYWRLGWYRCTQHGLTQRGSGSPPPADSWDLWAGACCQCVDRLL